ncbi:MAG: nucleotidyltransferase substrate binding protein [Lachnospiraceae bacterium]|nr:nucleotidyltransferase substrate binding protein [Lachnospiraceae bacterium]
MKKIENYAGSLSVLERADFTKVSDDEIYRMGVIGQFNLTFELAWKALREILRQNGISAADIGSPRDILKLSYEAHLLDDQEQWLLMLKKRNDSIHIHDEEEIDELMILIKDSFIPALKRLRGKLMEEVRKLDESSEYNA